MLVQTGSGTSRLVRAPNLYRALGEAMRQFDPATLLLVTNSKNNLTIVQHVPGTADSEVGPEVAQRFVNVGWIDMDSGEFHLMPGVLKTQMSTLNTKKLLQ